MYNKVALALLLEKFTTIKSIPTLVMLFFCVNQISSYKHNNLLAVLTHHVLGFFNRTIKTNVQFRKPLVLSYRTYKHKVTHPQNNIYLMHSGVKR